MRIFIVILFNICLSAQLLSQASVKTWSDFQDDNKTVTPRTVMMNDKYIYFFSHPQGSGDHYYIEMFDQKSLKPIKKIELYPEFDVLPRGFAGVTLFKDKLICFRGAYNKKTERNIFYAKKISLEGEVDKKEIELSNIEAPMGKSNPGYFSYKTSQNEDKILVIEHIKVEEHKTNVNITQFDADLNKLWKRTVPFNSNSQRFKIKDSEITRSVVSSDGGVHMLRRFQKEGDKKELKDHPKYFYNLYTCHSATDSMKETPLNFDDKFLDVGLGINDSHDLCITGTYSEKESKSMNQGRSKKDFSIEGVFYVRIDSKSDKILASTIHEFTPEFLQSFETADLTDNKKGIYCFDLNDLKILDDGSVIISGQQYYYSLAGEIGMGAPIGGGAAMGGAYTVAQAYAHDIYAVKINNDGALGWERLIKKSQHGSSGSIPMTGYGLFIYKDNLYFIFNDHPDNIDGKGPIREVKNLEGSKGRMVRLDTKGNITRSVLFDNKLNGAAYYPGISYYKSDMNTAIIFSSTEHRFKLGKIEFK